MKKEEIQSAKEMVEEKIKSLTDWIIKNHSNPYVNKESADVRSYERDRDYLNELDKKLYPRLPASTTLSDHASTPLGDQTQTK